MPCCAQMPQARDAGREALGDLDTLLKQEGLGWELGDLPGALLLLSVTEHRGEELPARESSEKRRWGQFAPCS